MLAIEAIVSALGFIALAICFGNIIAAAFLLPNGEPEPLRQSLVDSALAWLLGFLSISLVALVVQGAKIQRVSLPSADLYWRYITLTQSGRIWLARLIYAVVLATVIWRFHRNKPSFRNERWLALFALPLVASRSLMSHAVTVRENVTLAITSDALHLIVTAFWAGGLVALWHVFTLGRKRWPQRPPWSAEIVKRFSRVALASVALIVVTGFYQSWINVGSFAALLETDYGKTLLLKLVAVGAMLGLGALNLFSTKPLLNRLAQSDEDTVAARKTSQRRIALESCVGLLIFGITGLLTALRPGVHAFHQAGATRMSSGSAIGIKFGSTTQARRRR